MVQYLVDGLGQGGDGLKLWHVDARLSSDSEDIGRARPGKVFALVRCAARAIWIRLRHGPRVLYYVPSPAKRSSLYRDWLVMALVRPWYPRLVLHWHAVGLGAWLDSGANPLERWLTLRLLGRASMSLVLSELNSADAAKLSPRRISVAPNGIPDPCPDYATKVAAHRAARAAVVRAAVAPGGPPAEAEVLFLAMCSREKGVLDAVRAVSAANDALAGRGAGLRFRLRVAGEFINPVDLEEFEALATEARCVTRVGFLERKAKEEAYRSADFFLFPTFYPNEGQPLVLAEAMAWGLPPVTTRWRAIPEMLPPSWPGLVEAQDVGAAASALVDLAGSDLAPVRSRFEEAFTLSRHLGRMAAALREAAV